MFPYGFLYLPWNTCAGNGMMRQGFVMTGAVTIVTRRGLALARGIEGARSPGVSLSGEHFHRRLHLLEPLAALQQRDQGQTWRRV